MLRPQWVVLNKRSALYVLGLTVFLFLAIKGVGTLMSRGVGKMMPPQQMLATGIEKTRSSASFRYQTETRLTTAGKEVNDFFSKIEGERVAPDRARMTGVMMNMPIEFVQVGDTAYIKDQETSKWLTLPGNKLADSELFYAELNPLAYFNFKDVPDLKYKGLEKVNGEKLILLEMRPNLMDPFLELRLSDYFFKVWLSAEDYRLRQAMLQARDKQNPTGGIEITLRVWDYDEDIVINPPEVDPAAI